ncbi:MAG: lipoyl(octanoyl) transferase LipB, partial [Candidatus Thermoplasmatota archaeon]|nr:lipoyl(octanoyl) transferase LipB [Candidatus Thermoplasmatota archaeon]
LAVDLGRIGYEECLSLQKELVRKRAREEIPDILLFLEHDPVYTIGRKADPANYPGIDVTRTERGGDVTYHGPGQLVVYPIMKLWEGNRVNIRELVTEVTGALIGMLMEKGYSAELGEEPGIWVNGFKVASVGMAIESGVTYHGVALNLSMEAVEGFKKIRPCGLPPDTMSFVPVSREDAINGLLKEYSRRFGKFTFIKADQDSRPMSQILSSIPSLLLDTSE